MSSCLMALNVLLGILIYSFVDVNVTFCLPKDIPLNPKLLKEAIHFEEFMAAK